MRSFHWLWPLIFPSLWGALCKTPNLSGMAWCGAKIDREKKNQKKQGKKNGKQSNRSWTPHLASWGLPGLKYFQEWSIHKFSGQPGPHHPHGQEFLPNIPSEPTLSLKQIPLILSLCALGSRSLSWKWIFICPWNALAWKGSLGVS